jgi:RNA polymerase sigma factor for flagellar operon FliA
MTGPAKTPQQLMEECQDLVRSLAWKIHKKLPAYLDVEDLIGYGEVGLAEAARDYDPARGQFTTYAYYRIRGAIYDGLSKMTWFSRTHYNRLRYDQMANEILSSDNDERGAAASAGLGDDVRWLKNLSSSLAVVYLSTQGESEDEAGDLNLEDPSAPTPLVTAIGVEAKSQLHRLIDELPSDAASLIRGVYFEGLTLQDAGRRLGVSKAWASRLHAKTIEQLARSLRRLGVSD